MAPVEEIVARLAARLGPPTGAPESLDGGITNRNYRMRFGAEDYVIRLPGKDTGLLSISREAERIAGSAAAALGIAPELVAAEPDCTVTRYLRARPLSPGELASNPEPVARVLRLFHDSGVRLPACFWVPDLLEEYARVAIERGGELPDTYARTREIAGRIAAVLPLSDPAPCHNDLLPANLLALESDDGAPAEPRVPMLVDWEYAGMGHRLFDLGNFAVNNELDPQAEDRLLEAYFGEPPDASRRAALALMRIMSDAREAAWGVVQSVISELDFDFGGYAAQHFGRLAETASGLRLEEWLVAAAA
ncbi:MAG: phosphotransferase [Actinomycetota bacterium]|nr:phosphotransferase [Actinomycetota bacterium]